MPAADPTQTIIPGIAPSAADATKTAAAAEAPKYTESDFNARVTAELKRRDEENAAKIESAKKAAELAQAEKDGDFKKVLMEERKAREELQKQVEAETKARKTAERNILVQLVASDKKLTPRETASLKGETELELKADADLALKERGSVYAAARPATGTGPAVPRGTAFSGNGVGDDPAYRASVERMRRMVG